MSRPADRSAFPIMMDGRPGTYLAEPGMSLRDYFAARAMHQMLAGAVLPTGYDATTAFAIVGERAYEMADAMLTVRMAKDEA